MKKNYKNFLMTIEELREEMEEELTWRSNELRMFKNILASIKESDKNKYRKSLVVMLYSHFEGYTKTCLLIYVKYINSLKLKRKDIYSYSELIASSMNDVFKKYENKDRKNELFRRKFPSDKNLHNIYRRADLVNQFSNFLDEIVFIKDDIIDTESNLWSHILEKNLYKLSIKHDIFKSQYRQIDKLVNLRNSISHGSEKTGVSESNYIDLEKNILKNVMKRLIIIFEREANKLKEKSIA